MGEGGGHSSLTRMELDTAVSVNSWNEENTIKSPLIHILVRPIQNKSVNKDSLCFVSILVMSDPFLM